MPELDVIFFTLFSTLIVNYFLKKKKILLDKKYFNHKALVSNDEVPLSGGIIFLLSILIFYQPEFYQFKIIIFAIFLTGIISDVNFISSPSKRIAIQLFVISIFLYIDPTYIYSIRSDFFDHYLQNSYFGYFFTLFCLSILINGSNFMDGINILAIGYFLIVVSIIFYLSKNFNLELNTLLVKTVFSVLLVIFIFNFFGLLFLGDSGVYLISFVIGYILIHFSSDNYIVSPYFIACMLWYPAYENLFSIIRKKFDKKSATKPDQTHLHQLLYILIRNKLSHTDKTINTLTGFIVIFFNLFVLILGAKYFNDTKKLISLILLSILFYNCAYYYLKKISDRIS
jgi:UDP-N-acetylmuramyl pentapeptide phosphotransferase/UDP-N-acetylglucosamine-1-phosphate transferase